MNDIGIAPFRIQLYISINEAGEALKHYKIYDFQSIVVKHRNGVLTPTSYNVFLIHEDYTHGVSFSKHHVATVTNANGAFSKDNEPGQWAKIEVTHSGSYVTYSISY